MSETAQVTNTDNHDTPKTSTTKKILKGSLELAAIVIVSLFLSFILKAYFVQPFHIPSESMQNTLQVNDRIIVNKMKNEEKDLQRGDVIVFKDTKAWLPPAPEENPNIIQRILINTGIAEDTSEQYLVKRIIGMPGDRIECCSPSGKITVNGKEIDEPYVYTSSERPGREFNVIVPEGKVWVMGDHRDASADSRAHMNGPGNGFIDINDIQGKTAMVVWPFENFGKLDNHSAVFEKVPNPTN